MVATSSGSVHPAHRLTRRDDAFSRGDNQLEYMNWRQADRIEVQFRGHKGDQEQRGNVRVRTRAHVRGPRSGYRADGGAVALMVELLSFHPTLPDSAPLSSYCCGREVRVCQYDQALRAFREVVEKSGRDPKEFALHSLRIRGASTLARGLVNCNTPHLCPPPADFSGLFEFVHLLGFMTSGRRTLFFGRHQGLG